MTDCSCYGVIIDPIRKARFAGIFPDDHVPVRSPVLAGRAQVGTETIDFYEVDTSRMTEDQKRETARRVAPAFNLTEVEVLSNLNDPKFIIPLKADAVIVAWCPLHARMAAADIPYDDVRSE